MIEVMIAQVIEIIADGVHDFCEGIGLILSFLEMIIGQRGTFQVVAVIDEDGIFILQTSECMGDFAKAVVFFLVVGIAVRKDIGVDIGCHQYFDLIVHRYLLSTNMVAHVRVLLFMSFLLECSQMKEIRI